MVATREIARSSGSNLSRLTSVETRSTSLADYAHILRRRRLLIALVAVAVVVAAMVPLLAKEAVYSSTAQVQVSSLDDEGVFSDSDTERRIAGDQFRELENEIQIIRSASTRRSVREQLGADVGPFTGPSVAQVGTSDVLEITIKSEDPTVAADVANAYAEVVVASRRDRSVADLVAKASELREQAAHASDELESIAVRLANGGLSPNEVASLQVRQSTLATQSQDFTRRADQLDVESALRGRGTRIIEHAGLDLSPSQPPLVRTAALALVLGTLLGLAIAVVIDTIQDRLGDADELFTVRPGTPVLARIPHGTVDVESSGSRATPAGEEAFRYLRTNLRLAAQRSELRSLTVTSAVAGEGKSVTAAMLARTMAQAGDRVVLVDCDLRRPTLHHHFQLENEVGLTSLVTDDVSIGACTTFVAENLAVIPCGPAVADPTKILGHRRFTEMLESLTLQSDLVLLDTPPALPVADAIITSGLTDATLVVTRVGLVRRRAIRDLLRQLDEAGADLVGFVANDTERKALYGYSATEYTPSA